MTPSRKIEIRTPVRALLIASGLTVGVSLGAAAQSVAADGALLQPTPLILKDGRIANVSVHLVPFPPGQSALDRASVQRLASLTTEMATDCFLTAQVIGHVGSTEVLGSDTLNAHRLARARADSVQASLIADGLPAKAIASVWDWQFMVREARATLWVFRLTPGEDCEGTPLGVVAPALVAGAEPQPAPAPASEPRPEIAAASELRSVSTRESEPQSAPVAAPLDARGEERAALPDRAQTPAVFTPAAAPRPPAPDAAQAAAARPPAPGAAMSAGPSRAPADVPSVTQALPAVSPSTTRAAASDGEANPSAAATGAKPPVSQAPVKPATEVIAALPDRPEPARRPAADAKSEELMITFSTNSSYFPPGTAAQLRALVQKLASDQRYEVVLQTSVSGSRSVVGAETAEDAAQYNQWLAERRVERVQDWFGQNAEGHQVIIRPDYRADDESRQVVVRIRPAG